MKIAICLVVKNEAVELPYWLAWHRMIGFDTFLIFNDHSDDETESVILSLQTFYDIRYERNFPNRDRHDARQVRCYNAAVARFKGEFDWIAFFDADEYLDLNGEYLPEYMARFPSDVSQVAFNWCCIGTNGFVSRPEGPPFANYTKHAASVEYWNRHTKIILKPRKLELMAQVHCAFVEGRTVDASGNTPEWTNEHGGFTSKDPDWSNGRLLHYQSRSLEHYVKRDKNLEATRRNPNDPLHKITRDPNYSRVDHNLNPGYLRGFKTLLQKAALSQIASVGKNLSEISNAVIAQVAQVCEGAQISEFGDDHRSLVGGNMKYEYDRLHRPGLSSWAFMDETLNYAIYTLQNCDNSNVRFDALFIRDHDYAHLVDVDIKGDNRALPLKTYQIWQDVEGNICLSHPRTGRFLSLDPACRDELIADRKRAYEWENFKIVSEVDSRENPYGAKLYELTKDFCIERLVACGKALPNGIDAMPPHLRKTLTFMSKGVLGEHLL